MDQASIERVVDVYFNEPGSCSGKTEREGTEGAYVFMGGPNRVDVRGTGLQDWLAPMCQAIPEITDQGDEFTYRAPDGSRWRVCRDRNDWGSEVAMRRLASEVPRLEDLALEPLLVRGLLLGAWLEQGGLVVISGPAGSGKTTVAAAMVRSRLEKFGGRGVTVEHPPELPLDGRWGQGGACRQLAVTYQPPHNEYTGFVGGIRKALRKLPSTPPAVLLVGEVRDAETAAEVLKLALNGVLVVTTVHGLDPAASLARLHSLAADSLPGAASALAEGLRLVTHQRLSLSQDTQGWTRGRYNVRVLVSDGPLSTVAAHVREGRYEALSGVMGTQRTKLDLAQRAGLGAGELMSNLFPERA